MPAHDDIFQEKGCLQVMLHPLWKSASETQTKKGFKTTASFVF